MGFYPVQIEAAKALWKAIHSALDIPLECPTANGKMIETVDPECELSKFKGFINHYNLTKRKIDCAGLDLLTHLEDIKANI